ncbi:hypothetical protein O181_030021 [Austropuccinia psidii MF-1]|uniref:Uncharacterized protein n=1 Tax=Austropuccinia psidii MF-1 TaxID=1389203 RepID=A0A9Q3CS59_9BASI|nr:hypothetical protein [Austropuccinia psidii MF-1]
MQWHQYQMGVSAFHWVIKSHHPEDSSRLREKCQSQIPMTPSSNHQLFSFKVFLQGNTSNSFSRDIQESVPKQFVKSVNSPSIHLGNQDHSIQSGLIETCISIVHHGEIIQHNSFLNLSRYTFHQTINTDWLLS